MKITRRVNHFCWLMRDRIPLSSSYRNVIKDAYLCVMLSFLVALHHSLLIVQHQLRFHLTIVIQQNDIEKRRKVYRRLFSYDRGTHNE